MATLCLVCACIIACSGNNGWGWFLFVALLVGDK
ncbi:hypothetical protein HNR69_001247 [Histophilus somni]|nr:hypothetical protein [Histophilus somni]